MDKHAAVGAAVNRLPYPAIRNRALVILRERSEEEDDDSARRGSRSVDAAPSLIRGIGNPGLKHRAASLRMGIP